jgi:SAM-dependent methyltransferase
MSANEQQAEHWNGSEDEHWFAQADRYDRQLAPFADALFERINLTSSDRILDVGCGCGATTIAAAILGSRAVGVDLSTAMLALARERATRSGLTNTEFMLADAQTHPFESESFDIVISRFGVMFFDDPTAAFANLHSSMVDDGRLAFVCWQPLEANEWLLLPGLAAAQHVPLPDLGPSDGPGMFSLAAIQKIQIVLASAGYRDVSIESIAPTITLGGGGDVDETLDFLLGTGIAHAVLDPAPPDERSRAVDAIRAAICERYEPGIGVLMGSGAWLVTASA